MRAAGRALGVAYVLTGRARWERTDAGLGRVEIEPALVRVRDGRRVWAERYEADARDVFAVEGEIGARVADALGLTVGGATRVALGARPTQSFAAYTEFLRGESLRRSTPDEAKALEQALAAYERAVALDPTFALAYARIADVHGGMYWDYVDRSAQRLARMDAAAHTAVRLAPGSPDTHLALALAYYRGRRAYDPALAQLDTAIALAPGNRELYTTRGLIERRRGHFAAAIAAFQQAEALSPADPVLAGHLATTYVLMHAHPEAARYYERVLALDPSWAAIYADYASLLIAWRGDVAAARRVVHAGVRRSSPGDVGARLGALAPALVAPGEDSRRVLDAASPHVFRDNVGGRLVWHAQWWHARGDARRARAYADSARVVLERDRARRPTEVEYATDLATAYAILGRRAPALRESEAALAILPASRDALDGVEAVEARARVCTLVADAPCALAAFRQLLTMPSTVTPTALAASPVWQVWRADPRVAALARVTGERGRQPGGQDAVLPHRVDSPP